MLATLISRIFGLVRIQVINYYYKPEILDPFWAAYKIPNTLRELLAEGALSVAFIPVLTAYLVSRGLDEANRLASSVISFLFLINLVIVLLGIVFAGGLMPLYVSGFAQDSLRVQLAVDLARLMMPFLMFASMGAALMGVLNSHKHFAAPAFAPIFFTLGVVGTIILFQGSLGPAALGWGVLVGGVLMFLFQLPFAARYGFRFRFRLEWKHPGVREILRLMLPAALALGVVQLNQLMAPFFASYSKGGMAALQNSILLIQMPQGVFAIAVSTALLPSLSEHVSRGDYAAFRSDMRDGLGLVFLFTIPAALFFLFLGQEVVSALFNLGGKFQAEDVGMTARALFFYAFGLLSMGGTVLANRCFYSMKNTTTPLVVAVGSVVLNLIANVVFHLLQLGFEYIALANSIAVTANFVVLLLLIQKKSGSLPWANVLLECAKIVIASGLMVLLLSLLAPPLRSLLGRGPAGELLRLAVLVVAGAGMYFVVCRLLRVKEISMLKSAFRGRLGKGEE